MKKILLLFAFCQLLTGLSNQLLAQPPNSWSSADIHLALRKLNVLGSVLYVAAHPDDENTRLITYFSKEKLYRTGYLSLTRGDGGQNLIGDEQGIELGLIRTQELLAARRIDGGEQFFSRAFDFGYSKTPEETFSKWNKEKILSDVVWVIRKFQPDIIITRFPTTGEGGHGHHTGSAILANEAFSAAADPKRFPEQLKHVQTWQAKRILWNTFNFGGNNTISPDQFRVDVGGYNPLLGKSYGEIAAESRSQHKSQGFGMPALRGESFESFKTTGGDEPGKDLMDGVELSWKRVPGGEAIEKVVNELISSFDLAHPEKSVPGLVQLYKRLSQLPESYWKQQKLSEVKTLIAQCSGLFMDATTSVQYAVQTDSLRINFSLNNRLGADVVLEKLNLNGFDTSMHHSLPGNKNFNFSKTIFIPESTPVTQPYWLKQAMNEGHFNVNDPLQIGQPDVDRAFEVWFEVRIAGETFKFSRSVQYKFTDPVKGEVYQPVAVIPVVTFRDFNPIYIKSGRNKPVEISFVANKEVKIPNPPQVSQASFRGLDTIPKLFGALHLEKNNAHSVSLAEKDLEAKVYRLNTASDSRHGGAILRSINYDHIPAITYFKEAALTVKSIDLKTANKKIGYIIGAGDKVPEALEQMGYEVTLLTEKELSRNTLGQFDEIIAGVRPYNTNDWMGKYYDKLMQYVYNGGNYIVQYNTSNFISSIKSRIGPYDFTIGRTRVTDENAAVTFLDPAHPVLNFPNKITAADFKGWVQERSIYHASEQEHKFETILSMADADEEQHAGSLITAKYGEGYFTYTGLVFFRELPAGVTGAYRLLANLIALNSRR